LSSLCCYKNPFLLIKNIISGPKILVTFGHISNDQPTEMFISPGLISNSRVSVDCGHGKSEIFKSTSFDGRFENKMAQQSIAIDEQDLNGI
jgi:hypothetical protein